MVNTLVSELKKIGTNSKGIMVATDIFNYLVLAENMDDSKAVKFVAQIFVAQNTVIINKYHNLARAKFQHIGNKY